MTTPYTVFPNAYGSPAYTQPVAMRDPYIPQVSQQQTQTDSMIWVQGEEGMKSYRVAPNATVPLWDSEKQTIYLKSADAMGRPSVEYLDYTIREKSKPVPNDGPTYVTKDEFDKLNSQLSDISNQLKQLRTNKPKREEHYNG